MCRAGSRSARRLERLPTSCRQLNAKVVEIAKTEAMKKIMRGISVEVPLQTPAEIRKFLADDIKRNAEVIKIAKVVLE